jgi:hypothetical protein
VAFWIAEPGGCGSIEMVPRARGGWTLRHDVRGFTACMSSPPFGVVVLGASSPGRSWLGVANVDLTGSICTPVIKAGLHRNHSDLCRRRNAPQTLGKRDAERALSMLDAPESQVFAAE